MRRIMGAVLVLAIGQGLGRAEGADDALAVLDKGIAALGGEAKLAQAASLKWQATGKLTIEGNDNDFSIRYVTRGIDHVRAEFEGEFNGNAIKGATVLDGNKGWRKFGETNDLDADAVDNEKRNTYLQVVPITLVPLKDKAFKLEVAGEEKVDGKPATALKIVAPDGKSFRLLFDKETALPVKQVATVVGFGGDDFEQTSLFKDYKEMGGIKKASKVEVLRDGNAFLNVTIKDFQVVDKLPADAFAEPK